jgi:hypothetical protein
MKNQKLWMREPVLEYFNPIKSELLRVAVNQKMKAEGSIVQPAACGTELGAENES